MQVFYYMYIFRFSEVCMSSTLSITPFGQNQLWPSIQTSKNSNHLDLLMNALKMRTFIPWDAWQAPSHAGYLQAWTVRKQNLTGICSHMTGKSLQTCPRGFRSLENYLPNSICFCSLQARLLLTCLFRIEYEEAHYHPWLKAPPWLDHCIQWWTCVTMPWVVVVKPSNFAGVYIPHWIWGSILSPVTNDQCHTCPFPLLLVIDTCHLAMRWSLHPTPALPLPRLRKLGPWYNPWYGSSHSLPNL